MRNENSIETPELLIKGNIICWHESMIQLSNISYISTSPTGALKFPQYLVLLFIVDFISFFIYIIIEANLFLIIGLVLLTLGFGGIYHWWEKNEEREEKTYLNIIMNSGNDFKIIVNDKNFLNTILKVLEQIIIEGGVGEQNVSINISGCNISGNAEVLNDFKL